ncbi:MAG TPA: BON domain-containing protein [Stellaceae bacterium]|jgi:osmotically-inducible protein OsmY|nr:BON domain-containing protein [Stellaceae bacterium]
MPSTEDIVDRVRKSLHRDARIDIAHHPLRLSWTDGDLIIDGEVADVAAKKLALERVARVPGVDAIVDRLRVAPAEVMPDDRIRDLVCNALRQDSAFAACALSGWDKGRLEPVQAPTAPAGAITVTVADGVVTLDGDVPGLGLKRLAGVLAWWVPGSRDVVNGIGVTPPEDDNDEEITDAVRIALEKDPFVNASQIRVGTRNAVVTLAGLVPTPSEHDMAEFDAWYVFGVDQVVNRIGVRP